MTAKLRLTLDESDTAALRAHLQRTDADFMPALSLRTDLTTYANKLAAHARRVELWHGQTLVGLVAIYCNARPGGDAFISSVSLEPAWRGQGWADQLVSTACSLAREAGLSRVLLELHCDNQPALRLYKRHGFAPGDSTHHMLPMLLIL